MESTVSHTGYFKLTGLGSEKIESINIMLLAFTHQQGPHWT